MSLRTLIPASFMLFSLAACAPNSALEEVESEESSAEAIKGDTVYVVTRMDFKKCAYPMCGGVYVKAVNKTKTTCLDGSKQPDCYIGDIDFSPIGLSEDETWNAKQAAREGKLLLSGELAVMQGDIAKLTTFKAFQGETGAALSGTVYAVEASGITCITAPCPSFHAKKINSTLVKQLTDIELAALGLSPEQEAEILSSVFESSRIMSGKIKTVSAQFGTEKRLVVSEVYTTMEPAPAAQLCMDNAACGDGQHCDHSECLSNCPPGMVCPAVCWGQCVEGAVLCPGGGEICSSLCDGTGIVIPDGCPIPSCNCPPPVEPQAGSCVASCGGSAPDKSCYCDDLCTGYGDCCDDFAAVCQ